MAKGYWIVRVDVKNVEGMKPYAAANPNGGSTLKVYMTVWLERQSGPVERATMLAFSELQKCCR